MGMASAVETLCGQTYGAQKYEMLGIYLQRSTILLVATDIFITLIYIFTEPILKLIDQSNEIASAAALFIQAGHDKSAAFSVAVVNLVSFILCLIAAIVVLALRNVISYAFTDGETVARAVSELCPLLAFSLILNGIQPV